MSGEAANRGGNAAEIGAVLSLLRPWDIDRPKRRAGRARDGAYILFDQPADTDVVSFGVGCDVSFEFDMAMRGHRVVLHDHTVRRLPADHPNFRLVRAGLCAPGEETRRLRTLAEHVAALPDAGRRLILKVDVEGAEWGAFAAAPPELLARFDQILIETHWYRRLREPGFRETARAALTALADRFTLHHVHANNIVDLHLVGGMVVADVLELFYVRSDLATRRPSRTLYPTPLNRGNTGARPDHALLFYPFLPDGAEPPAIAALLERLAADVD